jgi:hypothetical protein
MEPDQNVGISETRAVDPDSLNPDPDPAFQVIQGRIEGFADQKLKIF